VPIKHLTGHLPKLSYQLFFDENTHDAVKELDTDILRTIRSALRTKDSPTPDEFLKSTETFLGGWGDVEDIPSVPFFSQEEEEYFIEQYKIQGFRNSELRHSHYMKW
jgi:soluble epoxide hydrolase / lipid-phosphate phosphatase